ncbi:MAG: hypothetical protein Q9173_006539 [Seirophora scorigena]
MASPSTPRRGRGNPSLPTGSEHQGRRRGRGQFRHDGSAAAPTSTTRATDPPVHATKPPAPRRRNRRRHRDVPLQQTAAISSIPAHRRRRIWLPIDMPREQAPASEDVDEPESSEGEPRASEPRTYSPPTQVEDRPDAYVVLEGGEASHRWMLPRGYVSSAVVSREADTGGKGKGKAREGRRKGAEEDFVAADDDISGEPVERNMTIEEHPPKLRAKGTGRPNIPGPSQRPTRLARTPDRDEEDEDDEGPARSGDAYAEGRDTTPVPERREALPDTARDDGDAAPYIQRFGSSAPPHQPAPAARQGRRGPSAAMEGSRVTPPGRLTAWPTRPSDTSTSHARASGVLPAAGTEEEDLMTFEENPEEDPLEDPPEAEEEKEEEDLITFD